MIEFADGAKITYDPEASALTAELPAGGTAEIIADGGITLRGDVTIEGSLAVSGNVTVDQTVTASEDVIADGISLTSHLHGGVQSGSSQSGTPV
jgi:phage baseplate assembly protein V